MRLPTPRNRMVVLGGSRSELHARIGQVETAVWVAA
jgi:hypothetical protein